MTRVDVRPAAFQDVDELCKLYLALHEFHAAAVPDRLNSLGAWEEFDAAPLTGGLQATLRDPRACILVADAVAEAKGKIVGFAEIHIREDEADVARAGYVYGHLRSLFVCEGWRKQGLGKRLVRAAEAWAAERGAAEVRLDTWEFPGDPVSFYEEIGYRTLKRKLVRRL